MRYFTAEEANAALAQVRPLTERVVELRREQLARRHELSEARASVAGNGGGIDARRVAKLDDAHTAAGAALGEALAEVEALGVQVKDLDTGLVDFPALHPSQGSTVLLCWQLGESEIGYWHTVEDGFAGRKPLPF